MGKILAPYISPEQIEQRAQMVLEHFDSSVTRAPQMTPLIPFMEFMRKEYKVVYDFDQDLGSTSYGTKVLGVFDKKHRGILVDRSLKGTKYFSHTLAHEIGHLVLHRKLNIPVEEYNFSPDTARDLVTGRKKIQTTKERIEWQANRFASAFVLPRSTFSAAIISCQKKMGVVRNLGTVFLDNTATNLRDFIDLLSRLQEIYSTSRPVLEYRLSDLGLLNDSRMNGNMHVSQLLSEE